jgi:DNA repair photolyase
LTKGRLPKEIWGLLGEYRSLVKARFGLVSLSQHYHRLFEPFTASPYLRLRQIEKCARLGIEVAVRIDPMIPFVSDSPENIDSLLRHLANCGVREVSVSYLVLRPGVVKQMVRELPSGVWKRVFQAYRGQPWQRVITSATTKLARKEIREKGYLLFRQLGERYGLKVRLCGCKNPDLPFESCLPWDTRVASRQKSLFGDS